MYKKQKEEVSVPYWINIPGGFAEHLAAESSLCQGEYITLQHTTKGSPRTK